MPESIAYLNGQLLPASQLAISVFDTGFVQGVTVAEQLRTFGGRLFRLEPHLERLRRSLDIIDVDPGLTNAELIELAEHIARHNHTLLAAGDDLGLSAFVTPGPYAGFTPADANSRPTVCLHTFAVAFHTFAEKYARGQSLVVTDVAQVPPTCWPPELKCRSRMHYFLADRAARRIDPAARALMLDGGGGVTEASTANVVAHFPNEGLVSPPREKILPGISVAVMGELAKQLGVPFSYRDLTVGELARADELFLTSTSPCVLPVTRLNGQPIGDGRPGELLGRLLAAWSELVGVDIVAQARKFSVRAN